MTISKTALPTEQSPKNVTSLVGAKLISSAAAYKHGSVTVLELTFSDSTTRFIKFGSNGALELAGTLEMGTGSRVSW